MGKRNSRKKYAYFDGSSGMSGDMVLGALLDLAGKHSRFIKKMGELGLPITIKIKEVQRASLRGLKVDVEVKKGRHLPSRKWKDIESLVIESPFSSAVKKNAMAIFKILFKAEAKVHGKKFQEAHLHEAAADDAVIDVVGCCYLAEELKIKDFSSTPLNLGKGWVKTSHGILPVPPPAVAELLRGVPVYSEWVGEELVTPTGAAIAKALVTKFAPFPEFTYEKIGCGAGARNFPDFPNILRIFYGEEKDLQPLKRVFLIEANIDDSSPQLLAGFMDTVLRLGALDVFMTPIVMKKNRLATKLTILTDVDKMDVLTSALFRETTSIGVRYFPVERRTLRREIQTVDVFGEKIGIKISYLDGKVVNAQPEYADCLKAARKRKLPPKEVLQAALNKFHRRGTKDG